MLTNADVKAILRDLAYLEERAYELGRQSDLPVEVRQRVLDGIYKKQVILSKIINLLAT